MSLKSTIESLAILLIQLANLKTKCKMNTELQNKVWSILPKEFKKEVKRLWQSADKEQQLPHDAFLRGEYSMLVSLFGFHNLTSDVEGEAVLTCDKSKAMQLYSHLLDLVENERMSEHYSGWCDLEREYIALFGENVFADYFGSKCLPDEDSDSTEDASQSKCRFFIDGKCKHPVICAGCDSSDSAEAEYRPKPAEPKNEGTRQEQYAPKKMIEYLATLPRVFRIYQKKK